MCLAAPSRQLFGTVVKLKTRRVICAFYTRDRNSCSQPKTHTRYSLSLTIMAQSSQRPVVFFDIHIGETPAGRMKMELFSDIVPKSVFSPLSFLRYLSCLTGSIERQRTSASYVPGNSGVLIRLMELRGLIVYERRANQRPQGYKGAIFHRYGVCLAPS